MTTKALYLHNLEQKIVWLLLFGILTMSFLYIYFVNSSIIHTAVWEENKETLSLKQTEVADLVSEYLALSSQIDLNLARKFGFIDASKKGRFITRDNLAITLSLNNEI